MPAPAIVALLVLGLLWGSAFPAIKVGLEGFGPGGFVLARHLVAALCFLPVLALRGYRLVPRRRDLGTFLVVGLVGITTYHLALTVAELRVSAGATSLIIATAPALSAVIAYFVSDDRLSRLGWLGSGVAFAGVALIAIGDAGALTIDAFAAFALLSALASALFFVLQKPLLTRYRPTEVVAFATWAGTIPLLGFAPGLVAQFGDAGLRAVGAALYAGIFPSAIAYTLFSFALSLAPVTRVTAFLYSVPVFSLTISWWVLGEVPSTLTLAGGAVAIAGIVLVNRSRRQIERRPVGGG